MFIGEILLESWETGSRDDIDETKIVQDLAVSNL